MPTLREIKELFNRWNNLTVRSYHKQGCDVLIGSRADPWECSCGTYESQETKDKAFIQLKDAIDTIK